MRIKPKTEEEVATRKLLPEGTYPFKIDNAEEKVSKNGNDMIVLVIEVYTPDGKSTVIYDYLMESMAYKLRHAAYACGLVAEYESGNLNDYDFKGKEGFLKLGIQKDKTGEYGDKNVVKDYIVADTGSQKTTPTKAKKADDADPFADEIPF